MPEKDIARLQRVQNCLARVVTKAPRFSSYSKTTTLASCQIRIHFKICAINFRTLKDNQPAYLVDVLVWPECSKYLHSTNSNKFVVPRIKTKTGSRAFSISGPASEFPPGMFERGGSKMGGRFWEFFPRRKKSDFLIFSAQNGLFQLK